MTPLPPQRTVRPGYRAVDRERFVPEAAKSRRRGDFARDRARVTHSSALRRLAAKTQVLGPATNDFVRNRLTHSLEVAQIGRELALALGGDPDVVETACLAHDLGHPPFGHNGENALAALCPAIGGFEGNAQTLRLLTRLEPKVVDPRTGRPAGLNLTRAVLDACTKYPWRRGQGPPGKEGKYGVYDADGEVFDWLRTGAAPGVRCLEAQLMDLADDIAYSVHDVEDAIAGGLVAPHLLADAGQRARVGALTCAWYLPDGSPEEVEEALARLRSTPSWLTGFDGGYRALAGLKDMSSQLIGRFTTGVVRSTRAVFGAGALLRYRADVVVPRSVVVEIAALKGIAGVWVMSDVDRRPHYHHERELLTELVLALAERAPEALEPAGAAAWREATDDAGRFRAVIDQVASLTDASATAWHARLTR